MVSASALTAQNLIANQISLGCGNLNTAYSPYVDNEGNYYIVSAVELGLGLPNLGNLTAESRGKTYMLITKYDEYHDIQWQLSYGGDSLDFGHYYALDDGFLFACTSNSPISGNKTIPSNGRNHIWLFKTDFDGNIVYQRGFYTNDDSGVNDIYKLNDGNLLISALASYGISGDKTSTGYAGVDGWFIKIDEDGNIIWDSAIGTNDDDNGFKIAGQFSNGDILLWQSTFGLASGAKTQDNFGLQNTWLIRISNITGQIEWEKTIGGIENGESLGDVKIINDKIYLITPSDSGIGGMRTVPKKGTRDIWFVVLNDSGEIIHQTSLGGDGIESLARIIDFNVNTTRLGVRSDSNISIDKNESSRGMADIWYLETDLFGNIQRQKTIGGNHNDWLNYMGILNNSNLLFVASSRSGINGDKTIARIASNSADIWILEIDAVTLDVVNEHQIVNNSVLFPNPTSNHINITFSEPTKLNKLVLYDLNGKIVLEQNFDSSLEANYSLNAQGLSSGIYTLNLVGNGFVKTQQVSIEK
jgi:hypothetical protein